MRETTHTGTGEFPAQMASNAENVSIWWRHHVRVHFYLDLSFSRVQFRYGASWAPRHPGTDNYNGDFTEIALVTNERLTGIITRSGGLVDGLQFVTNLQTYAWVGRHGGGGGTVTGVEIKFFVGDSRNGFVTQMRGVYMECWICMNIAMWNILTILLMR